MQRHFLRNLASAGILTTSMLVTLGVAVPASATDLNEEVPATVAPQMEAQRVFEDLNATLQNVDAPGIASYDPRVTESLDDGVRTATFPVPEQCEPSGTTNTLSCPAGEVILVPTVLTLSGEVVPFESELLNDQMVVTAVNDGEVFGLFAGGVSDVALVETLPETFASLLYEDAQAHSVAANEEVPVPTEDDDEPTGEWEEDWTKTEAPLEEIGEPWTPAPTDNEQEPTPIFGEVTADGSYKRPKSMVSVPSNYVYCVVWVATKCKPKNLHDYCSWSPDGFRYKTKLAWSEVTFRGPCARHDLAIDSIRKKSISLASKKAQRRNADATFKSHLRQNCGYKLYKSTPVRTACFGAASVYYGVVSGKTNDWNGS